MLQLVGSKRTGNYLAAAKAKIMRPAMADPHKSK